MRTGQAAGRCPELPTSSVAVCSDVVKQARANASADSLCPWLVEINNLQHGAVVEQHAKGQKCFDRHRVELRGLSHGLPYSPEAIAARCREPRGRRRRRTPLRVPALKRAARPPRYRGEPWGPSTPPQPRAIPRRGGLPELGDVTTPGSIVSKPQVYALALSAWE